MGNTYIGKMAEEEDTVHPHVHGEHIIRIATGQKIIGSSPRTWGTLLRLT